MPIPKSSTPALLLTMVRFLDPLRRRAAIRLSGMPQSPNPPIRIVAPSWTLSMPASGDGISLSMEILTVAVAQQIILQRNLSLVGSARNDLGTFVLGPNAPLIPRRVWPHNSFLTVSVANLCMKNEALVRSTEKIPVLPQRIPAINVATKTGRSRNG